MKTVKQIITTLFVTFFFFSTTVNAQLNVTSQLNEKPERLMVIRMSYSWLYKTSEGYAIYIRTSNQFDEYYMSINLGTDVKGITATCNDLISLIKNNVAAVTVEQGNGNLRITTHKIVGKTYLNIEQDGLAGESNITEQEINKVIEYFKDKENIPINQITQGNQQSGVNSNSYTLENEKSPIFKKFGFNNESSLIAYQKYVGKTIIYSPCSPISDFELEINSDKLSEDAKYVITEIQPDKGTLYPSTHLWITFCDIITNKKIRLRAPAQYSYQFPFFLVDDFEKYREGIIGTTFEDITLKGYYEITDVKFEKIKGSNRKSEIQYYVENKETGVKFATQNPVEDIEKQILQDKGGEFITELVKVDMPDCIKGEKKDISLVSGDNTSEYFYKDEIISVFILADGTKFKFRLTNQTENTMNIIWQDAVYVDYAGNTSRLLNNSNKYVEIEDKLPSTIVIRGATVNNEVVPSCNVLGLDERGKLKVCSYYPQSPMKDENKLLLMIPVQIKDVVYEYIFEFAVKFMSMYPDRLNY